MNNKNNTNKTNKMTTLKTLLMLSITSIIFVSGGIILAHATLGDELLTINNPTPEDGDRFGVSIAATNNGNILVGADHDNTNATDTGSVYLFDGTNGELLLTINNPTPEDGDRFGFSVVATNNGNILVGTPRDNTGATDTGSAYLFDGNDGSLLLTINNPTSAEGNDFGFSVATTNNGDLLVGAHRDDTNSSNAGSAYLFDGNDGSLLLTINNPTPEEDDFFGISVAATNNGNILVTAHRDDTNVTNAGTAYLFDGNDGSLLLTINNPTPEEDDRFGRFITTTNNGNIIVGTDGADSAYLFDGTNGELLLTMNNPTPEEGDRFSRSIATTNNGNILVAADHDNTNAIDAGSVYLFDGITGELLLTINNPTPGEGDRFGGSVATTNNGDLLVGTFFGDISSTDAGSAYLFEG